MLLKKFKESSVIPGFALTISYTLLYLTCIVLIPLSGPTFVTTAFANFDEVWKAVASPRVMAAYRISFGISFLAALINTFFGFIVAWVIVRYHFPGKKCSMLLSILLLLFLRPLPVLL